MLNHRTVLAPRRKSPAASQHEEDAAKDRSCWREKACARSYLTPVEADGVQEVREEAEGGRAVESRLAADTLKLHEFFAEAHENWIHLGQLADEQDNHAAREARGSLGLAQRGWAVSSASTEAYRPPLTRPCRPTRTSSREGSMLIFLSKSRDFQLALVIY